METPFPVISDVHICVLDSNIRVVVPTSPFPEKTALRSRSKTARLCFGSIMYGVAIIIESVLSISLDNPSPSLSTAKVGKTHKQAKKTKPIKTAVFRRNDGGLFGDVKIIIFPLFGIQKRILNCMAL